MTVEFGWWFLLLQTFLLMLAAFVLGAMVACLIRRGFASRPEHEQPVRIPAVETRPAAAAPTDPSTFMPSAPRPSAPEPAAATAAPATAPPLPSGRQLDTSRFERALKGDGAAPQSSQPAAPQPAVPQPEARPVPARPAPAPQQPQVSVVMPAAGGTGGPASAAATVITAPPASADDLTRIQSISPELVGALAGAGVTRFGDIASWSADDVARIGEKLNIRARIARENWIEQAQILAKGQETSYSRRHGRGETAVPPPQSVGARPVARAAPVAGPVASARTVSQAAPAASPGDDLQRIRGVTAELARTLNQHGVTRFAEIASWTAGDVQRFDGLLGAPGRIAHGNWIEQAQILAKGSLTSFARQAEAQSRTAPQRPTEPEPPRPTRLADAIKEQAQRPALESRASRTDMAGLRSVRSEALVGDTAQEGGRSALSRTGAGSDDLKRIRGIGVLIEKKLNSLGIARYEQIANWTGADIDRMSQLLDFRGRIERENWVEQARILASGGQTEFSRRVDKGDVDSSRERKT